ncbi:cation transporter [Moritella sp. 24]|uniref:cation transporter n=1 Tax=Moritella sp. 24 TaxID=2746230 RepID=UPI001BA6A4BB|nr:cation transporter [Moritella sp. 24]QUM75686.1 cation transporter [Moritella sp. 24]
MNNLQHRPDVNEANLVTRNLRLSNVVNRNELINEIDQLTGIDDVSYKDEENKIYLAYDASNLCLDDIEDIIRKHGTDIHDDWWTHTKQSFYKFVDQNVKDNAEHTAICCHKPPLRTTINKPK